VALKFLYAEGRNVCGWARRVAGCVGCRAVLGAFGGWRGLGLARSGRRSWAWSVMDVEVGLCSVGAG
jgi:hypothetical protein